MPSGVRARARAERERQVAEAAAEQAAREQAAARRRERLDRLGVRALPRRVGSLRRRVGSWRRRVRSLSLSKRGRQTGALAVRRRMRVRLLLAVLVLVNVLVWFVDSAWATRALALIASVLVAPVLYTVLFRKA